MAQTDKDNGKDKTEVIVYSVFVNYLSEGFDFPGIGFVNIAGGNHSTTYVGLVNYANRLSGMQIGLINTVKQLPLGAQIGLINTTLSCENKAVQIGLINTVKQLPSGAQIGLINTTLSGENKAVQIGLINTVKQLPSGAQIGLINTTLSGENKAVQIGLVNVNSNKLTGIQTGLVNVNHRKIKGLQLGVINYSDTISGVPIGIISIVRKGGYRALEVSFSEIAPVNVSFKLGVEKLYTSFNVAYNPNAAQEMMFGMGIGSIISLKNQFFFNPEISQMHTLQTKRCSNQQFWKAVPAFGFGFGRMNIVAGPSVCYSHATSDGISNQPVMPIFSHAFDSRNKIFAGVYAGIRVVL
jgi:hypothetical protein